MTEPFSDYHNVHLVGIKGVALTAMACCLHDLGKQIEGSDVIEDFVTKGQLDRLQIKIYTTFSPEDIHASTDLVIFSGAHKGSENPIVVAAKEKGIKCMTHAEALGVLMKGKTEVSVCGVGGKTTTSAMIAWILMHAGFKPSFAVGVGNIPNLGVPGRFDKESAYFVAEADEYVADPGHDNTPRFMFQHPNIIVCTNLELDHPDVYASFDDVKKAYTSFFQLLPDGGTLVYNAENDDLDALVKDFVKTRQERGKDVVAIPVSSVNSVWGVQGEYVVSQGKTSATVLCDGKKYTMELKVPGMFNMRNALYAVAVAHALGIPIETSLHAMSEFIGTMRRFENKGNSGDIQRYDDYAHHPTEIMATLKALREWYPKARVLAVFQPHTYSRTKALLDEFSQSFHDADEVILLDIFASAREAFDPSITSDILVERMREARQSSVQNLKTLEETASFLTHSLRPGDVLITLGAGDIYHLHDVL